MTTNAPHDLYLIRDIESGDAGSWSELYNGYREFYGVPADDVAVATTWAWMIGREFGLRGIVATDERGQVIALANLRLFARPSVGRMGLYRDASTTRTRRQHRG